MKRKRIGGIIFPFFLLVGCVGPSSLTMIDQKPSSVSGIYHEVQKGETLWRISQSYNVSMERIGSANHLPDPSRLQVGQLLFIPTTSVLSKAASAPTPARHKMPAESSRFIWPVKGRVVAYFGQETLLGKNKGINIAGDEGNSVVAANAGTVAFAGEKLKGFGRTVILEHGQQFQTIYAHNGALLVTQGEFVQQRQPIARLGRTGRVDQPTLHFEIRKANRPINPMNYLSRVP